MNNDLILGARALRKGTIRRVHQSETLHHRIECLGGTLWITQDGDRRDIVLQAGDSFTFDRPGDALISALDDSRFLLMETCALSASH